MEIEPRPYQTEAIELLREKAIAGLRVLLLVLSGGAGKTIIAAMLLRESMRKNSYVVFIAHRKELISQAKKKFGNYGIDTGIIMSGIKEETFKKIQIASIQTLGRRKEYPPAGLVLIDEAHRAYGPQYQKVISHYRRSGALIIGLTGTPFRTSKTEALKDVFQDYVSNITCTELLAAGFLTPAKVVGVEGAISTKGMKSKMGDYSDGDLMLAFDKENVYLNLISNYEKWAKGKKSIMFCCSVEHSIKSAAALTEAGYLFRHIDAETPTALRDQYVDEYNKGICIGLSNYGILAEGFDVPDTEVIIFNTATQSRIKWLQACWRGSRLAEGKKYYLVIDMADNCEKRFGYPDVDIEVSLEARSEKEESVKGLAPCKLCKECYVILPVSSRECKECGYVFPVKKTKVNEHSFVELARESKYRKWNNFGKKDWDKVPLEELEEFAAFKNYKPFWVRLEKERREKGWKHVKLEGFTGEKKQMYDICGVIQKKYYSQKPIDAHQFVFVRETAGELIFKYVVEESVTEEDGSN